MSERKAPAQGKGDKNRTSDYKRFYENYDEIFRKAKAKDKPEKLAKEIDTWINEGGSV